MLLKSPFFGLPLKGKFTERAFIPARCIHHATDVQRKFCSPAAGIAAPGGQTEDIARRIAGEVAPAFKKAGIDTYWVWMADKGNEPGFYFDELPAGDEAVRKTCRSSFNGSAIDDMLYRKGIDTVIVSGFYANECVFHSARGSAIHGYRTFVLTDCTDIKEMTDLQKKELYDQGVLFTTSAEMLARIRAAP